MQKCVLYDKNDDFNDGYQGKIMFLQKVKNCDLRVVMVTKKQYFLYFLQKVEKRDKKLSKKYFIT